MTLRKRLAAQSSCSNEFAGVPRSQKAAEAQKRHHRVESSGEALEGPTDVRFELGASPFRYGMSCGQPVVFLGSHKCYLGVGGHPAV